MATMDDKETKGASTAQGEADNTNIQPTEADKQAYADGVQAKQAQTVEDIKEAGRQLYRSNAKPIQIEGAKATINPVNRKWENPDRPNEGEDMEIRPRNTEVPKNEKAEEQPKKNYGSYADLVKEAYANSEQSAEQQKKDEKRMKALRALSLISDLGSGIANMIAATKGAKPVQAERATDMWQKRWDYYNKKKQERKDKLSSDFLVARMKDRAEQRTDDRDDRKIKSNEAIALAKEEGADRRHGEDLKNKYWNTAVKEEGNDRRAKEKNESSERIAKGHDATSRANTSSTNATSRANTTATNESRERNANRSAAKPAYGEYTDPYNGYGTGTNKEASKPKGGKGDSGKSTNNGQAFLNGI